MKDTQTKETQETQKRTQWALFQRIKYIDKKSIPLGEGWTRLDCSPILASGKFVKTHSFIYPDLKINRQRPVIRNRKELQGFLDKKLNKKYLSNLCDQLEKKAAIEENLRRLSDILEKLYMDLKDPLKLPKDEKRKTKDLEYGRQLYLQGSNKLKHLVSQPPLLPPATT